jgi:hypothetical protein
VLEFGLKRITIIVGGSDDWLSELRSSGHGDSMSIGETASESKREIDRIYCFLCF